MNNSRIGLSEFLLLLLGGALFVGISSYRLTELPPAWWDEGWTLSVARNWVEEGHYSHYLLGEPVMPSLAAHFPVVALVSGSFAIFGVGLLQARAVFVVCSLLSLLLLYLLTRRLVSRRAAALSMVLLCVFPVQWDLTPALLGRQVLGEMPALIFLTSGFLLLLHSGGIRRRYLAAAGLAFGVAMATKAQVPPFVVSGFVLTGVVFFWRDRRTTWTLLAVLGVAYATSFGVGWLRSVVINVSGVRPGSLSDFTGVIALVFDSDIRILTFRFALVSALPITLGLLAASLGHYRLIRQGPPPDWREPVSLILLGVSASWFFWYVFLSIGWGRHVFPAFS